MSLTKNQIKKINSLKLKKNRKNLGLFVVEGIKVVNEFMDSFFSLEEIYVTEDLYEHYKVYTNKITTITESDLKKISSLKTPNKVLAVFKMSFTSVINDKGLILALDGVNDPGNLGTIIRLCDWFGVDQLLCSTDTVDCFNSKVVQSTMGSLTRVNIIYTDLKEYLKKTHLPIYVTEMFGQNLYNTKLPNQAVVIMGNEANGVSKEILAFKNINSLTIPRYNQQSNVESLNVATATSIVLNEFRR